MIYLVIFFVGLIAAKWLLKPLAALLRALLMIIGIALAFRLTMAVVPLEVDWRGFWSGAVVGVLAILFGLGLVFYILGWNARVDATEAEENELSRQKRIRSRKAA